MAASPPHAPDLCAHESQTSCCCCHHCGAPLPPSLQALEAQFRALSQKHQGAVDRLADYEDEVRRLKSQQAHALQHASAHHDPALALLTPSTTRTSSEEVARPSTANPAIPSRASRFSSFLSRKSMSSSNTSASATAAAPAAAGMAHPAAFVPGAMPHQSDDDELRGALEKEKGLRTRAEGKLNAMSAEMEELSVTLFQQANEMVAEERKARAKLEERVDVLEKRDQEKRRRLARLENAMKRIERVRGLLGP
ncbi:hypothetical protein K490DRAFT_65102 [Saccharata proteae CBS 121410]|uniref:GDP/GTP exchange factor Sec2 N-terminal domain-containing protein n=1 Tax=Saccharata proteae CBS 121410 TaxID=1314787 RepID=A0A9P4M0E1_9PEZI|nr:hypothetical protein K490DRAFT_65102 [Saccharata proteae CBS 121410]